MTLRTSSLLTQFIVIHCTRHNDWTQTLEMEMKHCLNIIPPLRLLSRLPNETTLIKTLQLHAPLLADMCLSDPFSLHKRLCLIR